MKILVTENQNYILRRLQQFIDIVEDQIDGYELNDENPWWCGNNTPNSFLQNLKGRCIEIFVEQNSDFFHDDSNQGGANIDVSLLLLIIDEEYGNYVKNLFVRKCNYSRF